MDSVRQQRGGPRRGKIIDLMVRQKGRIGMTGLGQIRAYWEALCPAGDLPGRAQVDPRGIESALDIAFLAERIAPGLARFRVAGQRIDGLMGMSVQGMPLSALITPEARASFGEALERAFAGPSVVEMALRGEPGLMLPRLEARLLLLPLRAADGSLTRLLGGLALEGRVGSTPRRLDLVAVESTPITLTATPTAGTTPTPHRTPTPAPPPGMAEAPTPYSAPPPRRRPVLRVISNDD